MPFKLRPWHLIVVAAVVVVGILAAWTATSIAGAGSRYASDPMAPMSPMSPMPSMGQAPGPQQASATTGDVPSPAASTDARMSLGRAADRAETAAAGRATDAKVEHDRVGATYVTTYEVKVERTDGTRYDVVLDSAGRVLRTIRHLND